MCYGCRWSAARRSHLLTYPRIAPPIRCPDGDPFGKPAATPADVSRDGSPRHSASAISYRTRPRGQRAPRGATWGAVDPCRHLAPSPPTVRERPRGWQNSAARVAHLRATSTRMLPRHPAHRQERLRHSFACRHRSQQRQSNSVVTRTPISQRVGLVAGNNFRKGLSPLTKARNAPAGHRLRHQNRG
jgi:hypothetical protein